MGRALGPRLTARQHTGSRSPSSRPVDRFRNEDDARDPLSIPANRARRQRGGMHESGHPLLARNARSARRPARRDAPRPGTMHPLRPRALALSTATHTVWPIAAAVAVTALHPPSDHRGAVLQRDHRQRSYCATARGHVSDGKVHDGKRKITLSSAS